VPVDRLYQIDPLEDRRWSKLLQWHPRASVFHSLAWLRSLQKTYGYQPVAFTSSPLGEALRDAVLFCAVDSWLTGRRLVSLPFSDHCSPLVSDAAESDRFIAALEREFHGRRWKYFELRPLSLEQSPGDEWNVSGEYFFHRLDLRPDIDVLFRNFHSSSTQRKIRRAERERLRYVEGSSEALLDAFYCLLVITRKRHHIPPQPKNWFRNLMESFGNDLKIRVAYKGDRAVAGMLTIRHKQTLYYKYGGSDPRFHNLGSMHLLYWKSIQDAKGLGLTSLDFGRVDIDQPGLITFKNRWGAVAAPLRYYRFGRSHRSVHGFEPAVSFERRMISRVCSLSPSWVLPLWGTLLYKHIG